MTGGFISRWNPIEIEIERDEDEIFLYPTRSDMQDECYLISAQDFVKYLESWRRTTVPQSEKGYDLMEVPYGHWNWLLKKGKVLNRISIKELELR